MVGNAIEAAVVAAGRPGLRCLGLLLLVALLALPLGPARAQSDDANSGDATEQSGDQDGADQSSDENVDQNSNDPSGQESSGASDEATQRGADYFVGNFLFILYHEIGHGLVDKLDIPVVGREEDAADQLATLVLLDVGNDTVSGVPALTAALGWMAEWDRRGDQADDALFFDEHSLDRQRYANIVCLVYGSDPDHFKNLIAEWDLPEDRAESCPFDYQKVDRSWYALLGDALVEEGKSAPAGNVSFTAAVEPAKSEAYQEIARIMQENHNFENIATDLNKQFVLPSPIKLVARECGEENAFYDPETSTVNMCYEWMNVWLTDARKMAQGQ